MKDHDLLEAIGGIDEKYINNAMIPDVKPVRRYMKWGSLAAAVLVVALGSALVIPRLSNRNGEPVSEFNTAEVQTDDVTDIRILSAGVYVPPYTIPEKKGDATAENDMLALVVYNGGIYTDTFIRMENNDGILDEFLGTADGKIDEWSSQKEYTTEFASSMIGEVYSVKGYDRGFRIAVRTEYFDAQDNVVSYITILDRLNDITLTCGRDLFESRLHIGEYAESIVYETHEDWNMCMNNFQTPAVTGEEFAEFFEQVNNASFEYLWTPGIKNNESIYSRDQAHLFINLTNGTSVELRLIKGGYVGYSPMGWYFVRIPEETFNKIYTACGGK